jgi:predicted nucleotide-binding protein
MALNNPTPDYATQDLRTYVISQLSALIDYVADCPHVVDDESSPAHRLIPATITLLLDITRRLLSPDVLPNSAWLRQVSDIFEKLDSVVRGNGQQDTSVAQVPQLFELAIDLLNKDHQYLRIAPIPVDEELATDIKDLQQKIGADYAELKVRRLSRPKAPEVPYSLSIETGKPRLFLGSSVEGKKYAEFIQLGLEHDVECTIWDQGVFSPSLTTMETLVDRASTFDFAVIVMTADDILIKRGVESKMPRDNLLFEIGLFTGALGRSRTYVVYPNDQPIEFPSV